MDTLTIIDNTMEYLKPLHDRMDKTRDWVYSVPYKMPDLSDPKKSMDNVISVTMPYAAIIANTVINDIMTSFRQTIVNGDISPRTQRYIEEFIDASREQADEQLVKSDWHSTLFEIWSSHVCVRSFIGTRWVSQIIDGKYTINCLPVDMRYVAYEYGNDGMNWVSNRSFRSMAKIEAQYGEFLKANKIKIKKPSGSNTTSDIQVDDWWSSDRHELWIGGSEVINQPHSLGEPPFVITAPTTGFMLRDKGYIEHDSEDILYLIRGILNEMNRSVSIEQTKGAETLRPPYIQEQEKPDGKPAGAVPVTSQVKKYRTGERPHLLETPDVNTAFLTGRADLSKILQMGGVNDIDLGNVSQTVSAVWITAQAGIRKKFSGPRLKAIAEADKQLARLMIKQTQSAVELESGSPDILVGGTGRKLKYNPEKLGDSEKYFVRIELRSQSKTEEIANLAQFVAAPDLPYRWRLEHILGVDDPDAIMRERAYEESLELDPAQRFADLGLKLAREAEEIDDEREADAVKLRSMMNIERAVAILKERLNPAPMPVEQPARKPGENPAITGGSPKPLVNLPKLLNPGGQSGLPTQPREPQAV